MIYIYIAIGLALIGMGILTFPKKKDKTLRVKAKKNFYTGPNKMRLSIEAGKVYEVRQVSQDGVNYLLALPEGGSFGWTAKRDYEIVE